VCAFIVMERLRITRQIHCKAVEQRATLIHRQYNRDWGTSYSRPPTDPYLTSPLLQNPGGGTGLSFPDSNSTVLLLYYTHRGNESVPRIIINYTIFFSQTAVNILAIANQNSFRLVSDKIASAYFILFWKYINMLALGTGTVPDVSFPISHRRTTTPRF